MDNDLMARRLRPPSEPPRPQNGHSPTPSDTPPWAAVPESQDEAPWDRPQAEPWPPSTTDEQTESQVWPPTPAPTADMTPGEPASDRPADQPSAATDEVLNQSMWEPGPATPWDAPAETPSPDPQPWRAPDQPQNRVAPEPVMSEPAAPTAQPAQPEVVVQQPAAQADEDASDVSVPGRAPWDKPEPYSWAAQESVDDRPADMLESYDEMVPRVTRAVAAASAASAQQAVNDPDDSQAPVLKDVSQSADSTWPRTPNQPAFAGKVVGPTPPDDLFGTPRSAKPGKRHAEVREPAPEPVAQLPTLFSTSPTFPQQQPLVLRIELAIVDESRKLKPADAARRVGPALGDDDDADTVTPRHPEFEPRNHLAPPVDEPVVTQNPIPSPTTGPAPWVTAATTAEANPADLPWALPPLEPLAPAQPPAAEVVPWAYQPVQPAPPSPVPPLPVQQVWADPNPTSSWTLEPAPADPLSSLPAATFAPAAQPVQAPPVQPQFAPPQPAVAPAPAVQAAPVAQPQPASAPVQAAPVVRPAANVDQSDLWFLASEPDVSAVAEPETDKSGQPSTLLTAGLTIAMAVVVIVLVLVFIQLMTSLLR